MITLNIEKQVDGINYRTQSWSVKIQIINSTRTNTNSLFRIHYLKGRHYFHGIASPVDLLELDNAPATDDNTFWLTDSIDLLLRCEPDADEVIRLVKIELDEFDRSLKLSTNPTSIGTVEVGANV